MAETQRFIDMIHYICGSCGDPAALGATKLNKIAWFVDTLSFRMNGASLSGEVYVKRQFGPVPRNIQSALASLEAQGKIVVIEPKVQYQPRQFIARQAPDPGVFSNQERELLDLIIHEVCEKHTATSISDVSHNQIWDAALMGEVIPMEAVLAAYPGEITQEDLLWANAVVERVASKTAA